MTAFWNEINYVNYCDKKYFKMKQMTGNNPLVVDLDFVRFRPTWNQ